MTAQLRPKYDYAAHYARINAMGKRAPEVSPREQAIEKRYANKDPMEALNELAEAHAERHEVSIAKAMTTIITTTDAGRYLAKRERDARLIRAVGGGVAPSRPTPSQRASGSPSGGEFVRDALVRKMEVIDAGKLAHDLASQIAKAIAGSVGMGIEDAMVSQAADGLPIELDELVTAHIAEHPGMSRASATAAVLRTTEGRAAYDQDRQARIDRASAPYNFSPATSTARKAATLAQPAGGSAYEQLQKLAAARRKLEPGLSQEQAFDRIYSDPRHRNLADAHRAEERERRFGARG